MMLGNQLIRRLQSLTSRSPWVAVATRMSPSPPAQGLLWAQITAGLPAGDGRCPSPWAAPLEAPLSSPVKWGWRWQPHTASL